MPELAVQQTLGPYVLLREIGQGGAALVFEARDTRTQAVVAVKLLKTLGLPPERRAEAVARLKREAHTLAGLSHPYIVALHEGFQHQPGPAGGFDYLALEYLDGATLRTRLSWSGMAPDRTLYLLEQVADALDTLHAVGLVHRDLRPANILRLRDGDVKLIDFGSAGRAGELAPVPSGSPVYVAPELRRGRPATPASDLWALGVLLYEMLAGHPPFAADTREALLRQIARDDPAPLPPVHARVEGVVRRALAKDPPSRYPSARALVQDFADAVGVPTCWSLEAPPAAPVPPPAPVRPAWRRPAWLGGAMAGAAGLLIAVLAAPSLRWRPPPPPPRAAPTPVRVRIAAARQERRPHLEVLILPPHKAGAALAPLLAPAPPDSERPASWPPLRLLPPGPPVRPTANTAETLMAPVPPPPRPAPAYALTALGPLGEDVQGLNDRGQSVGGLNGVAVLWDGGALRRLDPPPVHTALTPYSEAAAINNQEQVVGFSRSHAVLWQAGRVQDLGAATGSPSNAAAVNDQGQVVGTSHGHAVLWQDGGMTDLGTLGGDESHARAINDRGQVVGVAYTARRYYHAFLWQGGAMQDLGTLGGPSSMAVAINGRGQVAGLSVTAAGATHAFLWQAGHMTDLGALSGASQAYGIGPRGEVVGSSAGEAVLWRGGKIVDLNRLVGPASGVALHRAVAVNARGQILCYGQRRGRRTVQAFLLTPASSLLSASRDDGG